MPQPRELVAIKILFRPEHCQGADIWGSCLQGFGSLTKTSRWQDLRGVSNSRTNRQFEARSLLETTPTPVVSKTFWVLKIFSSPRARCGLKCAGKVGNLQEGTKMRRKVKKSMSMTYFSLCPLCATVHKPWTLIQIAITTQTSMFLLVTISCKWL